jgi:hypothetical protein
MPRVDLGFGTGQMNLEHRDLVDDISQLVLVPQADPNPMRGVARLGRRRTRSDLGTKGLPGPSRSEGGPRSPDG